MRLHYAGQPGDGFGWGVCNANLIRELGKRCEIVGPDDADVVFMPLCNHEFDPLTPARGKVNLAYTFFESPLGICAQDNARRYDVVFAGSTWCMDRMKEAGITNGRLLIQGVEPIDRQWRIFSGGKLEWRKGHDLVIAAVARFMRDHPEAHLVTSWFNPWPELIASIGQSPFIVIPSGRFTSQHELTLALLSENGISEDRATILPHMPRAELINEMARTHVGLFPNRCEGGTNLVLMEYLSLGRPAVANLLTGHADLAAANIIPIAAKEDAQHWAVQTVPDIVAALEVARGPRWTWDAAVETILSCIDI